MHVHISHIWNRTFSTNKHVLLACGISMPGGRHTDTQAPRLDFASQEETCCKKGQGLDDLDVSSCHEDVFFGQQGYQPSPKKDIKLGCSHTQKQWLPSEAFIFTRLESPKRPLLATAAERHKMQLDHWNKWKTALQSNVLTYIVVNLHVWNDKYLVEVSLYIVSLSASFTRHLQHILQKRTFVHLYIMN